jgi:DNA-binding transcriptional ArsR family regulator
MSSAMRVRLPAVYTPEFVVSPAVEWLHAMDLVALADDWGQGFADWVYTTRAALSEKEYADLAVCNRAVSWGCLLARLDPVGRLPGTFENLSRSLRALDAAAFAGLGEEPCSGETPRGDALLSRRAVELVRSPAKLKATYIRTAEAFLEKRLRPRWEEDSVLLGEEVERRRERVWPATLLAWIETLTGRGLSLNASFETAEKLIAVPTRLLGPFVTLSLLATKPSAVLLIYGPDSAPKFSGAPETTPTRAAAGFKALGDETRLRILELTAEREMYAHEIGLEFSHIGQAAVSRHLRYLAALGLLTARDAQAKTYYALNRGCIRHLRAQLDALATPAAATNEKRKRRSP